MSCPSCAEPLEDYTEQEGGWCPRCKEWFPADVVTEWLMEQEQSDEYVFDEEEEETE